MSNTPTSNCCPTCRTVLFELSLPAAIERALWDFTAIPYVSTILLVVIMFCMLVRWVIHLYFRLNNVYFYADHLVDNLTDIRSRKPKFTLAGAKRCFTFFNMLPSLLLALYSFKYDYLFMKNLYGASQVIFVTSIYSRGHGTFSNNRDRVYFAAIVCAAFGIQFPVTSIMFNGEVGLELLPRL
jgi:hypothetical protein